MFIIFETGTQHQKASTLCMNSIACHLVRRITTGHIQYHFIDSWFLTELIGFSDLTCRVFVHRKAKIPGGQVQRPIIPGKSRAYSYARWISSRRVRWWWTPRTIQSSAESAGNVEQRERSLAGAQCKSPASAGVEWIADFILSLDFSLPRRIELMWISISPANVAP